MYSNTNNAALSNSNVVTFSVVIPTYNESENILRLITEIENNLPTSHFTEIIIVDDNSPDGTGKLVENYIQEQNAKLENGRDNSSNSSSKNYRVKVVHRRAKNGLIPAILDGVKQSTGMNVLIMDADFSHPPEVIPKMMRELALNPNSIIIGSRFIEGGKVVGWPQRRKLLSRGASALARLGLNVKRVKDPMSGFFALPRELIQNISIDTKGYKILLEILVKNKEIPIREIPYTFTDRQSGKSKMNYNVIMNYAEAIWQLYRHGQKSGQVEISERINKKSVLFISKAGRYYTVGLSGLIINYIVSFLLANDVANSIRLLSNVWYLEASILGVAISSTSNFFLNKYWTFEDKRFDVGVTARQFVSFIAVSAIGLSIQITLLYYMVEHLIPYRISLIVAIGVATTINFILNKKFTFKEKLWA
ncbi:MAG TPA: glycosyltransferase family 2 protein [Nitrososphaeraceae archaeon]|nr:glycosyltransferase family 2 protein [Nitrososphaeraceae archaeon]